jgi:hypothetical protein
MVVKRRRFKQSQPLEERLAQDTAQLREKAEVLPPGGTREAIMRRITQYSSGVGRLVELQVSGEDLALRLALRSVDAGRGSGRG